MKALIHGNLYKIDDGSTLIENYNETLDSAVIRISHLNEEIENLEPFDDIELQENDGTKYRDMCINSFDCIQEAIGQSDTTFSYTINLFSLTKKLEGIILPNLSITPYKNVEDRISIYDYLSRIRDVYSPRHWDNNSYLVDWGFSQEFYEKFDNINCPEMQWSNPTFRELFNDLTMIGDCIVILRKKKENETSYHDSSFIKANYVIDFLDLTKINDASSKHYNYIQKSRSSDDYISEIRMDLQNVMQTNVEGINNIVTTTEYLTLTSDDAVITSDNCYLKTQFPILNIKHLWIALLQGNMEKKTIMFKYDLCNIDAKWASPVGDEASLLYEKMEYDTLQLLYRRKINEPGTDTSKNISNFYSKHKNYCIYYTRNTNRIQGFNLLSNPVLRPQRTALEYIKTICNENAKRDPSLLISPGNIVINDDVNAYFSTFFQIEYETTYNAVFQASKGDRPNNSRIIADNQTNAWVDAYSQGFLEYQKANRLGNLQKMYNQRVFSYNDIYKISDQIGDDIVYRTEYQFYPDHTECNAYATKNYVLRDYFTGIKSKIRTWVNAKEEAFIRHDLKKYYCEFGYEQKTISDQVESLNINKYLAYYLLSSLTGIQDAANPIKYALIRTGKFGDSPVYDKFYPDSSHKFALNCVTRLIGNSIVLTAGFDDNWIVDKHPNTGEPGGQTYEDTGLIDKDDIVPLTFDESQSGWVDIPTLPTFNPVGGDDIGGIATNYYKYCDDNGEFDYIWIYFLNELNVSDVSFPLEYDDREDVQQYFIDLYNLPSVSDDITNSYKFGLTLPIYKDNKEKPVISTQFEFCVADKSIYFTKLFLERQDMIRNIAKSNLTAYASDTFSKEIPNDAVTTPFSADSLTITNINDYCVSITANAGGTKKYLYICDANGNLIIVFDKTKTLYLNIRRYM